MNTSKFLDYFNPHELVKFPVHIIGCGAIGSHVAEQLARMDVPNIHMWDFDTVEAKNIANQMFMAKDIGMTKVDAAETMMKAINPDICKITKHPEGIKPGEVVNGYIFLCVDNIDLRREIVKANMYNPNCVGFADFRMRLTDAQYYFAERTNKGRMDNLLASMDFTHEEAVEATPKSACGVELSVIYSVKSIVSLGVANFVKFCQKEKTSTTLLTDMNMMSLDAFSI